MKKNIFLLIGLVMAVLTFGSCSDDDNDAVGTQNPEQEVSGVYVGSWHQSLANSSGEVQEEKDADGMITLEPGEQWVVKLNVSKAAPVIPNAFTDVANCSGNSNSGYLIVNTKSVNLTNFSARLKDGVLTLVYQTEVKSGRKTFTATNTFTGVLQAPGEDL